MIVPVEAIFKPQQALFELPAELRVGPSCPPPMPTMCTWAPMARRNRWGRRRLQAPQHQPRLLDGSTPAGTATAR
ncbi:hypothetical protein NWF32_25720 [Pseudomonas qingdaonensis]|nr:hypothetical protein [Pseudomonas qingdaonensis]